MNAPTDPRAALAGYTVGTLNERPICYTEDAVKAVAAATTIAALEAAGQAMRRLRASMNGSAILAPCAS